MPSTPIVASGHISLAMFVAIVVIVFRRNPRFKCGPKKGAPKKGGVGERPTIDIILKLRSA